MINFISLSNVATYVDEPQVMSNLSKFNFIFGSNASGKTTITRVITNGKKKYPSCEIRWKNGTPMQTLIYNQDFIEDNFSESTNLKGVFTLGESQVETSRNIAKIKSEINNLQDEINSLRKTLQGEDEGGGKNRELVELENQLVDKCWKQKQKYDNIFKSAFEGYRNNKKKFKEKVLQKFQDNQVRLCDFEDLKNRASLIFGKRLVIKDSVPIICLSSLIKHESNLILKKRIIGKEDVDIAAMIERLGNSDWVRQGKKYFEDNNNICPFCQQYTDESFSKSLKDYFDETFITDINKIEDLSNQYATDAEKIQRDLSRILTNSSKFSEFLDINRLDKVKQRLDSEIMLNKQYLEIKKKEAIQSIELRSLKSIASEIAELIEIANNRISNHNQMVNNSTSEHTILTDQIWKFVIEELNDDLRDYMKKKSDLNQAIDSLNRKIVQSKNKKERKINDLKSLERQRTSIQPTIDAINSLLVSFGFTNFSLAKASEAFYKLVRADGTNAQTTLSEGEKTFITFLYFYHLLEGSISESDIMTDRVVVIDDPVSSLDADILFIVSSLIKELFKKMCNNESYIKQIFILTHNVYFHKEVTFSSKKRKSGIETFWVIRKSDNGPKIENHQSNPIKTSYELLWYEVKNPDHSKLTIQNTLRRILENYFKILGDVNIEEICSRFHGPDRIVCKSLFSWLNDGSHSVHDDINVALDSDNVQQNLQIFRKIFEKSGHIAHYRMMMGDERTD